MRSSADKLTIGIAPQIAPRTIFRMKQLDDTGMVQNIRIPQNLSVLKVTGIISEANSKVFLRVHYMYMTE